MNSNELYGFRGPTPPPLKKTQDNQNPIILFGIQKMLKSLGDHKIQGDRGRYFYTNEVRWGHGEGQIKVRITPNWGIIIERASSDLQGDQVWIIKRVFKIKIEEYTKEEETVAGELAEVIEDLSKKPIDSCKEDYKLHRLINSLIDKVKLANLIFVYQYTKKHNEYWYSINFSLRAAGVGQLARRFKTTQTPEGILEIAFYPDAGYIHVILTTVGISEEGSSWELNTPYFVGDFSPTQKIEEISKSVMMALKMV